MLNAVKYEKELKEYGVNFAVTTNGKLVKCEGCDCHDCLFKNGCMFLRLEWLLEEYKEPILSDEAKNYLKAFIKPFKCSSVCRTWGPSNSSNAWYQLKFFTNNGNFYTSILYENTTQLYEYFKDMEINRTYKLEELGL